MISFEPVPDLNAQLARNISLNQLKNVLLLKFGLSDEQGELPLYASATRGKDGSRVNEGLASLYPSEMRSKKLEPARIERLDEVFEDLGIDRVDLIKIDTEGAELNVLRGAVETIRRFRPRIIVEINQAALASAGSSAEGLMELLRSLGYELELIGDKGATLRLAEHEVPDLCDILATPTDGGNAVGGVN